MNITSSTSNLALNPAAQAGMSVLEAVTPALTLVAAVAHVGAAFFARRMPPPAQDRHTPPSVRAAFREQSQGPDVHANRMAFLKQLPDSVAGREQDAPVERDVDAATDHAHDHTHDSADDVRRKDSAEEGAVARKQAVETEGDAATLAPSNTARSAVTGPVSDDGDSVDSGEGHHEHAGTLRRERREVADSCMEPPPPVLKEMLDSEGLYGDVGNLDCLADLAPHRYTFFERVAGDARLLAKAAWLQVRSMQEALVSGLPCEGHRCLAEFGFKNTPQQLEELHDGLHQMVRCLDSGRPALLVATARTDPFAETERGGRRLYALAEGSRDGIQLVLTERFFDECTVEAATILLTELSHFFLGGRDYFELARSGECAERLALGHPVPPGAQLNAIEQRQRLLPHHLTPRDLSADPNAREILYAAYQYKVGGRYEPEELDTAALVERFRHDVTTQQEMNPANANSLGHLIASLANLHFRERGAMPLYDGPMPRGE